MEKELEIEYCKNCDDIYATNANIWLMFGYFDGESNNCDDDVFECPRCRLLIRRYDGYLGALERRDSFDFINELLRDISDLKDDSLTTLRNLLPNFTVPSFAVVLDGDALNELSELNRKRYVKAEVVEDRTIVTLNAHKLDLFDNESLLLEMVYQRDFINYPEHLSNIDSYYLRRKGRINALIDDFTECDKEAVLSQFDGKCALTGKVVPLHFDHVIPVAVGHGGTTKANMLPIWQRINSSKGSKNIFDWYEERGEDYEVCPIRFEQVIDYLADLNKMSVMEYRDYVYECHANPNDTLTKESV